jgi:hypothetical protein
MTAFVIVGAAAVSLVSVASVGAVSSVISRSFRA